MLTAAAKLLMGLLRERSHQAMGVATSSKISVVMVANLSDNQSGLKFKSVNKGFRWLVGKRAAAPKNQLNYQIEQHLPEQA